MTKLLTKEDFAPHVGKVFRFVQADYSMPLHQIDGGDTPMAGYARPPFILIFANRRAGPTLAEGIYDVEVDGGDGQGGQSFWFHICPMHQPDMELQFYQAVMS